MGYIVKSHVQENVILKKDLKSLQSISQTLSIKTKYVCLSVLSMLADKLNMTPEEAERWIVNLIRNARLDAKIDSKLVSIIVGLVHAV